MVAPTSAGVRQRVAIETATITVKASSTVQAAAWVVSVSGQPSRPRPDRGVGHPHPQECRATSCTWWSRATRSPRSLASSVRPWRRSLPPTGSPIRTRSGSGKSCESRCDPVGDGGRRQRPRHSPASTASVHANDSPMADVVASAASRGIALAGLGQYRHGASPTDDHGPALIVGYATPAGHSHRAAISALARHLAAGYSGSVPTVQP